MLENEAEVAETLEACEHILEEKADECRELWAVIAALRTCREWVEKQMEGSLKGAF